MSAIAPAGMASSMTGRLSAASTRATMAGDDDSEVISHPAPTSCIQVPTFETIVAIHRPRKSGRRRGLHAEDEPESAPSRGVVCRGFFRGFQCRTSDVHAPEATYSAVWSRACATRSGGGRSSARCSDHLLSILVDVTAKGRRRRGAWRRASAIAPCPAPRTADTCPWKRRSRTAPPSIPRDRPGRSFDAP